MKDIDTIVIAVGGQGRRITAELKRREIKTSKIFLKLNGKPFLSHLIDMSLALNFQKVFLLSSYYERELRIFLKENYPSANQIVPIYGGKSGKKLGVPWLLYSIKQKLRKPFIYSDGNILYNKSILKKLKDAELMKPTIANVVLNSKDLAPTHSRMIVHNSRIKSVNMRLPSSKDRKINLQGRKYYSLGLMALNSDIFSSIPSFAYKKDLDFVIHDIFRLDENMVKATIYKGSWIAVHNIHDVDKLGIKS